MMFSWRTALRNWNGLAHFPIVRRPVGGCFKLHQYIRYEVLFEGISQQEWTATYLLLGMLSGSLLSRWTKAEFDNGHSVGRSAASASC